MPKPKLTLKCANCGSNILPSYTREGGIIYIYPNAKLLVQYDKLKIMGTCIFCEKTERGENHDKTKNV